jgi:heme exporter protein D
MSLAMDTIAHYLEMGGYAGFVWPAFILSVLVLAGLLIHAVRALRRSEAALAEIGATAIVEEETPA